MSLVKLFHPSPLSISPRGDPSTTLDHPSLRYLNRIVPNRAISQSKIARINRLQGPRCFQRHRFTHQKSPSGICQLATSWFFVERSGNPLRSFLVLRIAKMRIHRNAMDIYFWKGIIMLKLSNKGSTSSKRSIPFIYRAKWNAALALFFSHRGEIKVSELNKPNNFNFAVHKWLENRHSAWYYE